METRDKKGQSRYNRQELLGEIGKKGQELLKEATIAVVGVGALGTTTANLLVRAGIGNILLIDRDIIELHNLQRQTVFTEKNVGQPKAEAAKGWLQEVNSETKIEAKLVDLNAETISILKEKKCDLILDCTDNMETRFLINDCAIKNNIPWIYCSAVGTKGRLLTILPDKTACLRCLFQMPKPGSLETCDTAGVMNTITTTMSAMQTTEAIKIITKQQPTKQLIAYDIWTQELQKIKVQKKKDCVCCSKKQFEFLEGKSATEAITLCGQGRIQIRGQKPNLAALKKRLEKSGKVKAMSYGIHFSGEETDFFLFADGRCLIRAQTKEEAKALYGKYVGN
ncbi:ThiF family adenylyltransferase [Candidatus Woesearchaeota archaeon]|nr:ThiF family adenylyltransferase [Candidatus Woesearchaeota archaeon]